ncbi:MAG: hypothetical protein JWP57_4389 [Spirosoma sp.]|nr:hypothetical protein [Spirosoma sp.]
MPLPRSCSGCAFFQPKGTLCRRHASGPGNEEWELVRWPLVRPVDRCGVGVEIEDGKEGTVSCGHCIHWLQPDDDGLKPDYRQGLSREWWKEAGYCTRFSPSPSTEEDRKTFWRVTHSSDRCGDGEAVQENIDDE